MKPCGVWLFVKLLTRRTLYTEDGQPILKKRSDLTLEDHVGLQMNVIIPIGVRVGSKSVIGANTVLRSDVPASSLIYQNPELRIKKNVTTGLQKII